MNALISKIKKLVREYRTRKNNPTCIIERNVVIDRGSRLSGDNVIGDETVLLKSSVGKYTYIRDDCYFYKARIGKFCSIASNVKVIYGRHPVEGNVSTSPVFYLKEGNGKKVFCQEERITEDYKYPRATEDCLVDIGHDVWIGNDARIMCGVKIGTGSVIGAGALVTKNVPPYSVVGGVPAKIIRYRFSEDDIAVLLNSQWWEKTDDWFIEHADAFMDINEFKRIIKSL